MREAGGFLRPKTDGGEEGKGVTHCKALSSGKTSPPTRNIAFLVGPERWGTDIFPLTEISFRLRLQPSSRYRQDFPPVRKGRVIKLASGQLAEFDAVGLDR